MKRFVFGVTVTALLCGFSAPVATKDRAYYEKRGEIIWEVPGENKRIALTFDDGPYPDTTEPILDLLKEYHAKATFFVVGNRVESFPETIKREIAEGHEVANHTFNHYFLQKKTYQTVQNEIMKTEQALEKVTGKKPSLFRPPGGFYNDQMLAIAKKNGYTTVLWSWHQDTNDWRSPGVQRIVNKVLNNARNGDIILLHDYVPRSVQTVEALKIILPELQRRGYEMVTVSDLINNRDSVLNPY
ncbi:MULTISPECIES: polysaccharide deacetylase family protein [unclassified Paenibacillus]|uniref:polysaccharide deacetylase family protein n=1 Tax=unclassified Paenibacillus TaxID=185978 RepID=UPI001051BDF5|nr:MULTISPECIES: polysaccharide deacetylase family protein [unclassified Paenibacillus]NIK69156.1 polysaccharide deacetylase family sporulation protein PdaB [Paenibacillus sp. BK720]TCM92887.1 polysaccharide deacetylase family sporulation protein PdaB [Paenibacillus sp. BK033]